MKYRSITYRTSNENGDKEIKLEMHRTLMDWLLRRPGRVHVFVNPNGIDIYNWFDKKTGRSAGLYWDIECLNAVNKHDLACL